MNEDHRYLINVILIREGRPKYWEFHCPYCQTKICELDGNIVQMRDVTNEQLRAVNRIRCPGGKKWCRMWYEFVLA